ncbi:hypothetical protein O0235_04875 [Tepidiforma flava]|uniref:Uncharacterized protein n=1 Tax=Tepidiforma flava TaxID=3004094 RepID=A0ABY7M9U6_9CHLR|nr:hypothetical protein [Tepidiforma flava]WBL36897.1 hypothetical protein O0235_04875 [Tepidiforma flava]
MPALRAGAGRGGWRLEVIPAPCSLLPAPSSLLPPPSSQLPTP